MGKDYYYWQPRKRSWKNCEGSRAFEDTIYKRNMGSSYWRGGAVQEGASKRGGLIFSCHRERRSCCWTFSTKNNQTAFALFATRMYHWKIFVLLIFGFLEVSENIFTPKISGFTVAYVNCLVTVFMPILDDQQLAVLWIAASTEENIKIFGLLTSGPQSTVLL